MERYLLTEQDIKKANTYVPMVKKVTLAQLIATFCLEQQAVAIKDGDSTTVLPDIFQRSQMRETQFKMGVLAQEYLNRPFEPVHAKLDDEEEKPVPYLMSADDVDRYGNIECQIDRMKRNREVADSCYELLADYHTWLKMLNQEIVAQLAIKNDPVGRFVQAMNQGTSPEQLQSLMEQLKQAQSESEAMQNDAKTKGNA